MSQMIHYQDDLYFLSVLVKSLEAGLSSEADPEFFQDRILGDIAFVDDSAHRFFELLSQNALLIERAEYLKLLERTSKAFCRVLDGLLHAGFPRSADYRAFGAQIAAILRDQRTLLGELSTLVFSTVEGEAETELVSQDELSELLKE